jgi:hypothetical protein
MPVQPPFSFGIVGTLVVICAASVVVYALLVRRWTTRRNWVSLSDWACDRRMKLAKDLSTLPPPIDRLADRGALVRLRVDDPQNGTAIVQFQTDLPTGAPASTTQAPCWNVLIRRLPRPHAPAGLRPTHAASSVVELFRLTPFHGLSNERFVLLAESGRTAQKLAKSSARALLPADVGLLVLDDWMVLDFSARPFDPIELDRMLSVAQQVSAVA